MAGDAAEAPELVEPEDENPPRRRGYGKRVAKWLIGGLAALLVLIALALAVLNSPIGQRFIVDQIAKVAPASGLKISIGRIEGDI